MRGSDEWTGELFSYVDIEERVPENHPLRLRLLRPDNESRSSTRPRSAPSPRNSSAFLICSLLAFLSAGAEIART